MKETVNQMMARNQVVNPPSPANKVVSVEKQPNGDLLCKQGSGNTFLLPASETEMQAFVIFTMIHHNSL